MFVKPAVQVQKRGRGGGGRRAAISRTGHTNRGRVRQKSHKSAELLEIGELRCDKPCNGFQLQNSRLDCCLCIAAP